MLKKGSKNHLRSFIRRSPQGKFGDPGEIRSTKPFAESSVALEWCVIRMCNRWVFVAGLFNSALETLVHRLDSETKSRWNGPFDIAARAVRTASLFATLIEAIAITNRFGEPMKWWEQTRSLPLILQAQANALHPHVGRFESR